MRRTIASRAGVGLLVLSLTLGAAVSAGADYTYFDDFSGDDAVNDSYWHSPFVENVPQIHLEGVLSYVNRTDGPTLGFFGGFEVNSEAYLGYAFPIAGPTPGIASVELSFEVPNSWSDPLRGLMTVTVSYDGAPDETTHVITETGAFAYNLMPSVPCQRVFVHFVGDNVAIDDLSVMLMSVTPTECETWGSIKALYR